MTPNEILAILCIVSFFAIFQAIRCRNHMTLIRSVVRRRNDKPRHRRRH